MAEKNKLRSLLLFFLKILLAAAVLYILFTRNAHEIVQCLRTFDFRYLFPVLLLSLVQNIFSSWRWQSLASIAEIKLGFFESFSLTMQGNFFSLVIPGGAIGGDVVKMGVLSHRRSAGTRMEGAFTILIDRIVGMLSLFSLTLAILIPAVPLLMKMRFADLPEEPALNIVFIAGTAGLSLAGIIAGCGIFFHRTLQRIPGIKQLMKKAELLFPEMYSRVTKTADGYAASWKKLIFLTVLTTFLVHLMAVYSFLLLLAGMDVQFNSFYVLTAVVIGNVAGLIPFFPGGIGIRDLVTITILAAGGMADGDAKTVQLLATAVMLVVNLTGGLFFIFAPGRSRSIGECNNEQQ